MENERLISLDAVINKLKYERQNCKPVEVFDDYFTEYKKRLIPRLLNDVIVYLENHPTVDAIPVSWLKEKLTNHPEISYATSDGICAVLHLWEGRKDNE